MKAANSKITAKTTYTELKAMVPDARKLRTEDGKKMRTPSGKALISDSKQKVLVSVKENGHVITVYESGFFAYQDYRGVTARAVHNCETMYFPNGEDGFIAIPESEYKDADGNGLPFSVILEHFGDRNLQNQEAQRDKRKYAVSIDGGIRYMKVSGIHSGAKGQLDEALVSRDFADAACDRVCGTKGEKSQYRRMVEAVPEALDKLTNRQREVFLLYYVDRMTQKQIAEKIGIKQQSVQEALKAAEKKFKKYFGVA